MAIFTDDFNRANENPLASPWQSVNASGSLSGNGLKVDANQLVGNSGTNASILTGLEFLDDQSAKVTISATNTFCPAGVIVRGDVNGNGYLLYYNRNGDDVRLGTLTNGTFTNVQFFGDVGFIDGSTLELKAEGNVLRAYIDDVQIGTDVTDNTYTSGVTGAWYENGNGNLTKLDNFSSEGWSDIAILNVDSDDVIEDGQQDIPFTTRSFSGDITTVSITSGVYSTPLTGLTGTGTSYTVDLFDVSSFSSDTAGVPFTTANHVNSFEASDGADTATLEITRNPKAGWAVVDTVGAVATQGSVFENRVGGAMSDNSQVLYPTASNTTIAPDGTITTDADTVEGKAWDVDTGTWELFTVNFASADVTKPVITLIGNASVTITEGDTYNDAGATASDDVDGDITANIVTVNPVDTNTPAVYTVTYNVSDAAGNAADEVTRTVTVEETVVQLPTVDAGADLSVKAGEQVTIYGSSSSDISSWQWQEITGSGISLSGANTSNVSFVAPEEDYAQNIILRLTVTDTNGSSGSDDVNVKVAPVGGSVVTSSYRHGVYVKEVPTRRKFN